MIGKYFDGVLPQAREMEGPDEELIAMAKALPAQYGELMDQMHFSLALAEVFKLVSQCNRYIDLTAPWTLAKDDTKTARLGTVLYNLAECIRRVAVLLQPVLPDTPAKIFAQLAVGEEGTTWQSLEGFGALKSGAKVCPAPALFPRLDMEEELAAMAALKPAAQSAPQSVVEEAAAEASPAKAEITYEDFEKLDLRLALVTACEKVKKADKLLKLTLKVGAEERTVVSGIAKSYSPEEMVGKQVVLVYNLKPVKLKGILSQGMILCADGKGEMLKLITAEAGAEDGAGVR
jgi:methionyl-tRNA synthetase